MNFLNVSRIAKQEKETVLLQDISFGLQQGRQTALAGETGAGKSTLMKIIAGLLQADTGEVFFEGRKIKGPEEKLVPGHAGIAYLSQQFELPQFLRVEQVLSYANTLPPLQAQSLYEICRINQLLTRKTDQLSGGERQRIALARLLSTSPRLLLLDEPFSNLDMVHKNILKAVLHDIGESLRITCMLVSHDPEDSLSWADEILVLKSGALVQQGSPEQIYRQPVSTYVAGLFGRYNLLDPIQAKALSDLPGLSINGKSLLIRPESFKVKDTAAHALQGKLKQVRFFGSYYCLEVELPGTTLLLETRTTQLKAGDAINFSVAPDEVRYL